MEKFKEKFAKFSDKDHIYFPTSLKVVISFCFLLLNCQCVLNLLNDNAGNYLGNFGAFIITKDLIFVTIHIEKVTKKKVSDVTKLALHFGANKSI